MWLFCVAGIFVVFDFVANVDDLLRVGKETGSVATFMLTYYTFRTIPVIMMLGSLLGLVSAMVTVAMLMRLNELVPIQAAGVSALRIVTPLLVAFFLLVVTLTVVRELVLPRFLDELTLDFIGAADKKGRNVNAIIDSETGVYFHGDRLFQKEKRISNPSIAINQPVVKRTVNLKADNAVYHEAKGERPAGFMLVNVKGLKELPSDESLAFEGRPVVIMAVDSPDWIEPTDCFVTTRIPFAYFVSSESWSQYASTWEMIAAARNPSMDIGPRIRGTVHARLLSPFLDVAVIFLGLPIILSRGDRNVFKAMGLSAFIILSFIIVREGSLYLGTAIERPAIGAWLPLVLFGPVAVNQFLTLRNC